MGKTLGLLAGGHDDRYRFKSRCRQARGKPVVMQPRNGFIRDDGYKPGRGLRQACGYQRSGLTEEALPNVDLVGTFAQLDRHDHGHGWTSGRSSTRRASRAANIRLITASCGPSSDSIMMSAWA